ncbi:MAG TPA: Mur ligase family protein [Candidatus Limnocylindrales bacterium]|nr:Mur ligase family protein [Candidatus Limnocylindrales bacterium]
MSSPEPRPAPPAAAGPRTYAQALAAIEARGRYGIRLGLGRVRALLRELGEPERSVRGALVAGTNGKGSVIALAGSALRAAGHRVGETPKPHLVTYRERIVVDGQPIAAADFARLVDDAIRAADGLSRRLGPPTEFELLTAVMFRHFAEADLDVALVEVGLGGRLDATNAWDGGVAVLTNVGLDHTDRLGPTIGHIAREKAAIVKRGDLAVTGTQGEALAILRRRCARLGVPLVVAPPPPVLGWSRDALSVELPGLGATDIGLRGRHQAANAAVADALLDALERAGIATTPADARRRGYAAARWPGRLELLTVPVPARSSGATREVLLDGAHNPDGAAALARALDDLRPCLAGGAETPPAPVTVVWASMADKDVQGVIAAVATSPALAGATIICTAIDLPRALPAGDLAAAWRAGLPGADVRTAPSSAAALDLALRTGRGPVVVAGSLYLVGEARARLIDDAALRDPDEAPRPHDGPMSGTGR